MNRTTRRGLEALIGLAVVAAAVVWLSGGFSDKVAPGEIAGAPLAPPEDMQRAAVVAEQRPVVEWASGALASARQTAVAARILARIEDVRVRAGEAVAAGDVLVVLDARDLQARLAQAREAINAARARRDLAQAEQERYAELLKRGVATRQRHDQAVAELRTAQAEAERLDQGLREAEAGLSYTEIRAPIAGLVVDRLAEPGETASPGQPLLRIYDPAALRAEAPVRESLAVTLKPGDALAVQVPALDDTVPGRIEEIVPFAEPGARTLLVKVGLPQDPRLYAGLFARIAIPAGTRLRLLLPRAAVEQVGQLDYVTVAGRDGVLERRLVTLGDYSEDGLIEVLSGLRAGETVVYGAPSS